MYKKINNLDNSKWLYCNDFNSLTELRNQYEDFIDIYGLYPDAIRMTKRQYDKFKHLLLYYGCGVKEFHTYRGSKIIVT